tara:strand:- start:941 stop:1051 length:111 start_codon:yes stop_codon:yes gene_type:complete
MINKIAIIGFGSAGQRQIVFLYKRPLLKDILLNQKS